MNFHSVATTMLPSSHVSAADRRLLDSLELSWGLVLQVLLTLGIFVVIIIVITKVTSLQKQMRTVTTQDDAVRVQLQSVLNQVNAVVQDTDAVRTQLQSTIATMNDIASDADLMPTVQAKIDSALTSLTNVSNAISANTASLSTISSSVTANSSSLGTIASSVLANGSLVTLLMDSPEQQVFFLSKKLGYFTPSDIESVDAGTQKVTFKPPPGMSSHPFSGYKLLNTQDIQNMGKRGFTMCGCGWVYDVRTGTGLPESTPTGCGAPGNPCLGHIVTAYPGGRQFIGNNGCGNGANLNVCDFQRTDTGDFYGGVWLYGYEVNRETLASKANSINCNIHFYPITAVADT